MKGFSKGKRLISLLLTGVMLILASFSGAVFAEGETEVENLFDENMVYQFADTANYKSASEGVTLTEDGKDAVVVNGDTLTYEIPAVPESGMYMVSVTTKTVQDTSIYYTITGTVDETSWSGNFRCVTEYSIKVGSFYLEEGANTDIDLSIAMTADDKEMTLASIKVARKEDIFVSSSEETVIPALDYTNRVFRTGYSDDEVVGWSANTTGDETGWNKGKATVSSSSHYGIYNINAQAGLYDVYVLKSGTSSNAMALEVDGKVVTANHKGATSAVTLSQTGGYFKTVYTKLATVGLLEGHHELKVKNTTGSSYFIGIKLVPTDAKEVSPVLGEKTEFSFGKDYLKGESVFHAIADNVKTLIGATHTIEYYDDVQFDRAGSKVAQFTAPGHCGTYAVDVKETGIYDLSFVAGKYTANYNIYVDDVLVKSGAKAQLNNAGKGQTTYSHALVAEDYVTTLYLAEGFHKIKIEYGASGMHYVWFLERTAQSINPDETNSIYVTSSENYYAKFSGKTEVDTGNLSSNISPDEFDSYTQHGYATFRTGYYFDYFVTSPVAKDFILYSIAGSKYLMNVKITDISNNKVLYEGKLNDATSNYTVYTKTEMGRISLPEGLTTLRVSVTGGSAAWVSGFELVPAEDPILTMMDGEGNIIDGVCDGTMIFLVDLNGYEKDMIYFAIYEEVNDVKRLYKICKGNVAEGMADGAITDIEKAEGKTYSGKAFIWDGATINGFSYSF